MRRVVHERARRTATLLAPVTVPGSMAVLFALLGRWLPARRAYAVGFAVYWLGWGTAFPLWVLGPREAGTWLSGGRRPRAGETVLLVVPVIGAVATELVPQRRLVSGRVAATMVATAAVNAATEELLWRAIFLAQFPDDAARGRLWPLAGFTVWHLAPQLVLPSRRGRLPFLAGALLVGATATVVGSRCGGLRAVLLAHLATDACGVRAARFRLGLP
ncbi:type II CAAX prenyl endopeptidase Rce1 family protein [Georgenia yuyongxinii]|uniref:CPBP family intramembrane metalloprotease n=1 Tax=Georgenia yuyongxinii TaxID=2589797 RepID=A0A552WNJ1_9MICO|nr:CPBP family glutamic-type intramembrane protease [Georgenia yuyongxinii]TRW44073.1 CPBP family intramembrane metalloprotease [Georgenia yuyongxinii]